MVIYLLQRIGVAIVAFIFGVITGYYVILPNATRLIPDEFLAGVISGGTGFLIWYLILELALMWVEGKKNRF